MLARRSAAVLAALTALASTVCGAAPAQAPPETAPAATPVQVQSLTTLDMFTTGAADTGLGPDLWRGTSTALARQVLPRLAQKPLSPAAAMLARRVLATGASAPDGAAADDDLAGARNLALLALGDAGAVDVILRHAPSLANSEPLARAAAESALLLRADERACAIAAGLKSGRDGVYWLKLRTYCQLLAGDSEGAQLTFALAKEAAKDPVFARLMGVKLAGVGPPGAASLRDGLDLALTRSLGLDPRPALDTAGFAAAAEVARDPSVAQDTRVAAAARALRGGLTLADLFDGGAPPIVMPRPVPPGSPDLRAVDTEVPVQTVILELSTRPGVSAEAGLVVTAVQAPDVAVKVQALTALLARAKTGADFVVLSRLARPALSQLGHADGPIPQALLLARAAAASGDVAAARAIRGRISADAPDGASAADLALLDAVIAAAGGAVDTPTLDRLAERGAKDGPRSPAQPALVLLMSLGGALSPDARAEVASFDPPRGAASPARLALLRSAVQGRARGEAALLILAIALDAGPAGPAAADRAPIIAGLHDLGLAADAQAFAVEGLVGLK
jgi:hypothetical protein